MIQFKNLGQPGGVRLDGVRPVTLRAMAAAAEVFAREGAALVVTSVVDGLHMEGSKHYTGEAFDCRSKHLPDYETKLRVLGALEEALGKDFDVLLELVGDDSEHLHLEFDPKG
jgi:hypothetical protein